MIGDAIHRLIVAESSRLRSVLTRVLTWLFAIGALAIAVIAIDEAGKQNADRDAEPVIVALPPVSVLAVTPSDYRVRMQLLSRLGPRYRSEISSLVEGRVSFLGENFAEGADVQAQEVLARIDSSAYRAHRAEAAHALAQARVERAEEWRDAQQARREWERLGDNRQQPSSLFLRHPQAKAARLAEEAAEANLEHASGQLASTSIVAPFNATVKARGVSKGEFVSAGQVIAELVSNDEFEITAQLTPNQWELLDRNQLMRPMTVRDLSGANRWRAEVRSVGRLLDVRTQLRSVFLALEDKSNTATMVSGQFVEVEMPGRVLHDVLVLPESAYTRDSAIWVVDTDDQLRKLPATLLATQEQRVILERPEAEEDTYRVVIHPQARFIVGTRVDPVEPSPEAAGVRS